MTTVGTVERVDPDGMLRPGGASVRFTADGDTRARYLTLGRLRRRRWGQIGDVVYDPSESDRFIVDDVLYGPDRTYCPQRSRR